MQNGIFFIIERSICCKWEAKTFIQKNKIYSVRFFPVEIETNKGDTVLGYYVTELSGNLSYRRTKVHRRPLKNRKNIIFYGDLFGNRRGCRISPMYLADISKTPLNCQIGFWRSQFSFGFIRGHCQLIIISSPPRLPYKQHLSVEKTRVNNKLSRLCFRSYAPAEKSFW